ncbi:MAG: MotA/TolQ/ExbB proton channel family protein [Planctomycetota bacterium]|jgi:biopolymer transport protein ExbB/TolQ|nr:MotA/TolQ/ExbB proton channel family protein [Planctomycetota bacterium]
MRLEAALSSTIYLISGALLYPVMLFLIAGFAAAVAASGAVLAEWLERSRRGRGDPGLGREAGTGPERAARLLAGAGLRRFRELEQALERPGCTRRAAEDLYLEIEQNLWRRLDYLQILVRVGPSLGLMGTLIPMGTGLAALGRGDLSRLSGDLVVAFTTTVVGLAAGILAFAWLTVRKRWVADDLRLIRTAAETLAAALPEEGDGR